MKAGPRTLCRIKLSTTEDTGGLGGKILFGQV
jgi:hypothetical protein